MAKKYDVIALGELLIDFTMNGQSEQGNNMFEACPGGAPCNVLALLNKMGKKTAFIGKVGKDQFGALLRDTITEAGIDASNLMVDENVNTTLAFVHTFPDGDREFSFYRNPGADMMLTADEVNPEVVKATIVGEHGDAQIPIWSRVSIAGVPIQEYCENVGLRWGENIRKDISDKVREMGATIIKGKGRTHYGIATCVCYLAEAVLNQRLTIAPVSTMFQGEYGIEDVCLSVPSIIGVNGVEKRLEERWAEEEFLAFRQAAEKMRNVLKTL